MSRFLTDVGNPYQADPNSETIIVNQGDQDANHNAGGLSFGPDGYLYISLGDEGNAYDPFKNSQRIDKKLFSGILRIDVDCRPENIPSNPHEASSSHYHVPYDNPYVGVANFNGQHVSPREVLTEFYAVGLRNPFCIVFDPETGDLFANDVGQNMREEVDWIFPGGNYGWVAYEGHIRRTNQHVTPDTLSFYLPPLVDYQRNRGNAITAGIPYRGQYYPQLYGYYVFVDYGSGQLGRMRIADTPMYSKAKKLAHEIHVLELVLKSSTPELASNQMTWEAAQTLGWQVLRPTDMVSRHGATFSLLSDNSILVEGINSAGDSYRIFGTTTLSNLAGVRLEAIPDQSLPNNGPGRQDSGAFMISELEGYFSTSPDLEPNQRINLNAARFEVDGFEVTNLTDGTTHSSWSFAPKEGHGRLNPAMLGADQPLSANNQPSTLRFDFYHAEGTQANLGRFRISVTDDPADLTNSIPDFVAYLLAIPPPQRSPQQQESLNAFYRSIAPELNPTRQLLQSNRNELASLIRNQSPPVEWVTTQPGITSMAVHPGTDEILLANFHRGVILKLGYSQETIGQPLPETIADTGAFTDPTSLVPHSKVHFYEINSPFWSDHARKKRWFHAPDSFSAFEFQETGNWGLPLGAVWIKHFELEMVAGDPSSLRRLETRFLVRNNLGVHGFTYRWSDMQTNAHLVPESGMEEDLVILENGTNRVQRWRYPARNECLRCHTAAGGYALGFNTAQLNRIPSLGQAPTNQLVWMKSLGYLTNNFSDLNKLPTTALISDETQSILRRVRSYLFVNCGQCHQPGGNGQGVCDARYTLSLSEMNLVDAKPEDDFGDPRNRLIAPGDLEHSVLFQRLAQLGPHHMPPLATTVVNESALELLRRWILEELPFWAAGSNVPPSISL